MTARFGDSTSRPGSELESSDTRFSPVAAGPEILDVYRPVWMIKVFHRVVPRPAGSDGGDGAVIDQPPEFNTRHEHDRRPSRGQPGEQPTGPLNGSTLTVNLERSDSAIVVHVAGEADLLTAPRLEEAINTALAERPDALVVDLSEVGFLASAGLALLVAAYRQAGEHIRVRLVADGQLVMRPLEVSGIAAELEIFSTVREALAASRDRHEPSGEPVE